MSKRSTMAKGHLLLLFVWNFFRLSSCYINEQVDLIPYDVPEDNTFNFSDDEFIEYSLKSPFSFFKNTYDRVFISGNGQVSFSAGTGQFTPSCSPSSIPMIMAFWADAINRDAESKLFYRESIDRNLLRRVSLDVFRRFPNLRDIHLSWMLIVTWKDLPFFGVSAACDGLSKRNTFQLVLTTDGHHSFAVMYYKRIDWTTGTASSGNCNGLGGYPGKAGFDFGDNQNIFTIPGSCTDSILNITQTSNINSPGKYVFRIDSNLETKECNQFDNSQKLRVSPSVVSPYGHIPLALTGPCVFPTDKILCKYYVADKKIEFDGTPDSISNTVVCPTPSFDRLGKIIVKVTISRETGPENVYHNGSSSNNHSTSTESNMYFGSFYIINLDSSEDDAHVRVSFSESNLDGDAILVQVEWDPIYVKDRLLRNTLGRNIDGVIKKSGADEQLNLYLERYDSENWAVRKELKLEVENSGRFTGRIEVDDILQIFHASRPELLTVSVSDSKAGGALENNRKENKNKIFADALSVSIDFLRVASPIVARRAWIVAGIVAVGAAVYDYTAAPLFHAKCKAWAALEDNTIPTDTRACPPTRRSAEIDANFEKDSATILRWVFHPGSAYAVRQRVASDSGAGSQCVYRKDGSIMTKSPGGGTLDKYSPNKHFFRHLYHDVMPFFTCCMLAGSGSEKACEREYYRVRPSDDGSKYNGLSVSIAKGDPHITTYDGLVYTFNGVGEFWMVKMSNPTTNRTFNLQARMEQYVSLDGTPMPASVFTAFVLEEVVNDKNATIQVSYANGGIYVAIDEEYVDISENDIPRSGFRLSDEIYQITFYSSDNITVSVSSGFSFHFSTMGVNETALKIDIRITNRCRIV